jgi:hypothetical protein
MEYSSSHKNPSRETCQQIIKRILSMEIQQHGSNQHFRQASDFLSYFESLYPASDSLSKQVQRAIKAMDMPKDDQGFYVPDKTPLQLAQEKELKSIFVKSSQGTDTLEDCQTFFLFLKPASQDYVLQLISECDTFSNTYVTIQKCCNGLLFYTKDRKQLEIIFENLL